MTASRAIDDALRVKFPAIVGRAASNRMVGRCALAGADSFDTTQPTLSTLSKLAGLDNARRQLALAGCS